MIRTAILCPDTDLRNQLECALAEVRGLYLARRLSYYPDESELSRFFQASGSEVLFLSMEAPERALEISELAAQFAPEVEIVAVSRQLSEPLLLSLMRAGVRHALTSPFDPSTVASTAAEIVEKFEEREGVSKGGNVYSFLPAKPGGGTTVAAINTALALSREPNRRALLMDFDFNLGVVGSLLGLASRQGVFDTVIDALEHDEDRWFRRVASVEGLHVLPTGGLHPGMRVELTQLRYLLNFVRRNYTDVFIDMSGNMEAFSIDVLRESQRIVLVASLDPPSAHLTLQKINLLSRLDLADRLLVVATKPGDKDWLEVGDLEVYLNRHVEFFIPNDRRAVRAAINAHQPVASKSDFGKHCTQLARALVRPKPPGRLATLKRTFLEHFSLAPSS